MNHIDYQYWMQNSAIGLPYLSNDIKLICSTFPCRLGKQNRYQLNLLNTTLYYNTFREKIKKREYSRMGATFLPCSHIFAHRINAWFQKVCALFSRKITHICGIPLTIPFCLVDTVITKYSSLCVNEENWHSFCFLIVMEYEPKTKHFTISLQGEIKWKN